MSEKVLAHAVCDSILACTGELPRPRGYVARAVLQAGAYMLGLLILFGLLALLAGRGA